MIQNLILLFAGLMGLITAILNLKNHRLNNVMNIYMILIIITISSRFLLLGMIPIILGKSIMHNYLRYSNFSLIVIPLIYLYVKNLSNNNTVFNKKELLHFIFPLCFFIFTFNLNYLKIDYLGVKFVCYIVFFIFIVFYLYMTFRFLKENIWIRKDMIKLVNRQKKLNSRWTYFLYLSILFIVIRLLASMYLELVYGDSIRGLAYLWVSASIWLLIIFKILSTPELLYGYNTLHQKINKNRYENLSLKSNWKLNPTDKINNAQHLQLKEKIDSSILTYIEMIEEISLTDKIFRDSSITIVDVTNKLKLPKSHISYLFKYHSIISFSEFKKVIRIQDAIQLINENYLKENTLDYLSKKVGFPSYNTFFTSFKNITGYTPQKYIDNL